MQLLNYGENSGHSLVNCLKNNDKILVNITYLRPMNTWSRTSGVIFIWLSEALQYLVHEIFFCRCFQIKEATILEVMFRVCYFVGIVEARGNFFFALFSLCNIMSVHRAYIIICFFLLSCRCYVSKSFFSLITKILQHFNPVRVLLLHVRFK